MVQHNAVQRDADSLAENGDTNKAGISKIKVGVVLIDRFNMMSLTTSLEPMRIANFLLLQSFYEWEYLSFENLQVTASNGMMINCQAALESKYYDIIFVCGSWGCERETPQKIEGFLRKQARYGAMLCSFELGVYSLAKAGLLAGKQATTHWSYIAGLKEEFPDIDISEQLFTQDKNIACCSGGVASLDFVLSLIEKHHGAHLVSEITDQMMYHGKRPAQTPQRNALSSSDGKIHPDIKQVIALIQSNITEPPTIPEIAAHIGISQRQLERRCKDLMGCSIVQLSQILRLEHARTLLVSTSLSILDISVASGFNSVSHFSQAFRRYYQKKPSHYRKAWPDREPRPVWSGTFLSFNNQPNLYHTTTPVNPRDRKKFISPTMASGISGGAIKKPINVKPLSHTQAVKPLGKYLPPRG